MRIRVLAVLMALVLAGMGSGCGDSGSGKKAGPSEGGSTGGSSAAPSAPVVGTGGSRPQIGFIMPAAGSWRAVHAGVEKALQEGRKGPDGKPVVEVVWQEAKAGGQVEMAKEMIGKGVGAIVLAPEDKASLDGVVKEAGRTPVVAINTTDSADGVKAVIFADPLKSESKTPGLKPGVRFGGFGMSGDDVAKLRSGEIDALIVTDELEAGALALKTAKDCMSEKKVEKRIEVPCHVVTKENMDSAEVAPLLNPPVGMYLKE